MRGVFPLSRRRLLASLLLPQLAGQTPDAKPLFEEITPEASGIRWVHDNAISPQRYMPEAMGPGVAFFDYDNDGWQDLFFVQSGETDFWKPAKPLSCALYRNNRDGSFTDVTAKSGIAPVGFGMGVAAADYNNDGLTDLLVTSYGKPTLYRNRGDGTFEDVTLKSGLSKCTAGWTTSAVWFDYNNDGLLDLFLCNYLDFGPPGKHPSCEDNRLGRKYYCVPRVFNPTVNALFRNNGDGTFTDVTANSAFAKAPGKALGAVATDINNDGLLDLFVANDTVQNYLFMNRGKAGWEEVSLAAEVAFGENGQARSGMGVDSHDLDGDGWMDLTVTNIDQEMYSVYLNRKDETFADAAFRHGVAQASRTMSGWGLKFFDFNNDGQPDLFVANGHPDDMIDSYSRSVKYREPLLLFRHEGGVLKNISATAGPAFQKPLAARGLALGDYNNDGSVDVCVTTNGGAPLLLRNNAPEGHHWVGLKLVGKTANRDAIGAKLRWSAGGKVRSRLKVSGGSYLSSHDVREVLGLGAATKLDWVEVKWPAPSKLTERFLLAQIDRYHVLTEGTGQRSGSPGA
jgi:enediyne biosynthesis protein E4